MSQCLRPKAFLGEKRRKKKKKKKIEARSYSQNYNPDSREGPCFNRVEIAYVFIEWL